MSLLIQLWGEEGVQEQLEGAKRNKHVYEKIARQMKEKDIDKTADQCRTKMKKLKLDYRKIKDKHNKTGQGRKNWKHLDALDSILGHRPTTKPAVVLDTSSDQLFFDEQESGHNSSDLEDSLIIPDQVESSSSKSLLNTQKEVLLKTNMNLQTDLHQLYSVGLSDVKESVLKMP